MYKKDMAGLTPQSLWHSCGFSLPLEKNLQGYSLVSGVGVGAVHDS